MVVRPNPGFKFLSLLAGLSAVIGGSWPLRFFISGGFACVVFSVNHWSGHEILRAAMAWIAFYSQYLFRATNAARKRREAPHHAEGALFILFFVS